MVSSLTALLVVFGLLGALLVWARRLAGNAAAGGALEVVDAVPLGGGRAVTVVRSGERYFLVGSTAHSMALIAEVAAADVAASKHRGVSPAGLPVLPDLRARMRSLRNAVWWRKTETLRDGESLGDGESLRTESLRTESLRTGSLRKTGLLRNSGAADAFGGPAR
jgi:hypothetical protein